jgi:phosphatidylglycerol lysyltransferase
MTATPDEQPHTSGFKRLSSVLGPVLSIAMLVLALWYLHHELAGLSRAVLVQYMQAISPSAFVAAAGFTVLGYLALTTFDVTALRYLDKDLPLRRSVLTGFMAFAIGNNVGVSALSGGAIRYRMYTLAGLSAMEIARIIVFVTLTFLLGACALLGLALLIMPAAQTGLLHASPLLLEGSSIVFLAVPAVFLASAFFRRAPWRIGNLELAIPRPAIAGTQLFIAIADITLACATLYVLLAPHLDGGYFAFLGVYLLALGAGILSSVPGGIGVFEAVLIAALPQVDSALLLGTVLVYRLIYYVAPLALALLLLLGYESRHHGEMLRSSTVKARGWLSGIAPQLIGIAVFLCGVVLLVSGASPAIESRLKVVSLMLPLPVLELSHLVGSVVGVGLLILSRGLFRRLHAAYLATIAALLAGIGLSLLKGLDYEEALFLTLVLLSLWISRDRFYRRGSVIAQRIPVQWLGAVALSLCLALWVGLVSFRDVEYDHELWWQFAFDADAPRMLRASVVTAVVALGFALWTVLRKLPTAALAEHTQVEHVNVQRVIDSASYASANLALLGDKRFLWSEDKRAFIMYQIKGDSWIAMGDPVGPPELHEELAWTFRELVESYNARVVFYQVSDKSLGLYVDLGLTLAKLGEDARVPLAGFSLEGSARAALRQARNKGLKNGACFEVVPRLQVPAIAAELRGVSDRWLADKSTSEKGFSLGSFSEEYIANFDCGVVRVNGRIVAFANLWPAPAGSEISIDLMRYDQHAPKGMMDYLFTELLLWGRDQGYQWFNLGMAPLSGLEQRRFAPRWHKLGSLIYSHGESLYNFEGLRSYKEKFSPQWESRYLACPAGWVNLSLALVDASSLISGSVVKTLRR